MRRLPLTSRLRWYEKPLLGICGLLILALVILLRFPLPETEAEASLGLQSSKPGDQPSQKPKDAGARSLLCVPPEEITYSWNKYLAVAADRAGRFTLYGSPDPATGRPTNDSYGLLDGCAPQFSSANYATLRIEGEDIGKGFVSDAGSSTLGAQTTQNKGTNKGSSKGGRLSTTHRMPGAIGFTQILKLTNAGNPREDSRESSPGRGSLQMIYKLTNNSNDRRTVSVRATMTPVAANEGAAVKYFRPATDGSRLAAKITHERNLIAGADDTTAQLGPLVAPRPGAASNSSGYWSSGSPRNKVGSARREAVAPDRLTFASTPARLYTSPEFTYPVREGRTLGRGAPFAVYWMDVELDPGERVRLHHSYGFPPDDLIEAPAPRPERPSATTASFVNHGS